MTVRWQVQFKSLRGDKLYVVDIYSTGNYSTPTQLMGASNPFTTEEDNDEDFFKFIRTQTGHLRIVDDGLSGFNYQDLLPIEVLDRPIVLRQVTNGNSQTLWKGFIQIQQPDYELYEYPVVREYAIYDIFSVCQQLNFTFNITSPTYQYVNFAYVLKTVIDSLPEEVRPTGFGFEGYNTITDKLLAKINPQVFYNIAETSSYELKKANSRYTCYEALEEIAKFWGFCIRMQGNVMFMTQDFGLGGQDFMHATYAQLTTLSTGTSAGDRWTAAQAITIQSSWLASDENFLKSVQPYKGAKITGNAEPQSTLLSLFPQLSETYSAGVIGRTGRGIFLESHGTWNNSWYQQILIRSENNIYENVRLVDNSVNTLYIQAFSSWNNYLRTGTLWPSYFGGCIMSIKFDCVDFNTGQSIRNQGDKAPVGDTIMYMELSFEAFNGTTYYFDPTNGWSTTHSYFGCYICGANEYAYLYSHRPSGADTIIKYIQFSTLPVAPIGRIIAKLYGSETGPLYVKDFSLIVEKNNLNTVGEQTYQAGITQEAWEANSIFLNTSENVYESKFGFGVVLSKNNTENGLPISLRNVTNWVASYYSRSRMFVTFYLRSEVPNVENITPRVRINYGRSQFYPISISRNWRDDETTIIAAQVSSEDYAVYTVTLVAGTGISSVSGGGSVFAGDVITVSCVLSNGYVFSHWEDSNGVVVSDEQRYTIPSVNSNLTLTAIAVEDNREYTISIVNVLGVISTSGSGTYRIGTTVRISCVCDADHRFLEWRENNINGMWITSEQSFDVVVKRDMTFYPFIETTEEDIIRVYFNIQQPSWGYIDVNGDYIFHDGDQYEFLDGEVKQFTAIPATGYEFVKWVYNGNTYSNNAQINIIADSSFGDGIFLAVFQEKPVVTEWMLTLRTTIKDAVVQVGNTTYSFTAADTVFNIVVPAGASVRLYGYYDGFDPVSFIGWRDASQQGALLTSNPLEFIMASNKDYTIVFE